MASAPGIDELAGQDTHRINLTGDWWACWQPWKDGTEVLNCHQISIQQQGGKLPIAATTRGTQAQEGGYLGEGGLRLWDNGPIVTGWGTIAKPNNEGLALMNQLKEKGTVVTA